MIAISNGINRKIKILVIEDNETIQAGYRRHLEHVASLFPVTNLTDARKALEGAVKDKERGMPGYDFVVVDACIPRKAGERAISIPNTVSLVAEYRKMLATVPFIATSSEPLFNDQLVDAGCSYASDKAGLPELIRGLVA